MRYIVVSMLVANLFAACPVLAQRAAENAPAPSTACAPGQRAEPPTVGAGTEPLTDKLAQSKGVLCPPPGIDPKMPAEPPAGGRLKVLPPPGTPGGDQSIQPK